MIHRRVVLIALAGLLCAAPGLRADALDELARDYWAWRADTQPTNGDDIPRLERPLGWVPRWSPVAVGERRKALAAFEVRWKALDPSAWPVTDQVDYRLIGSALARGRWELDFARSWRRDAGFYLDQTLGALVEVLLPPPPFDQRRSEAIVRLLGNIPRTLGDARLNLGEARAPFGRLALDALREIGPRLRAAVADLEPQLDGKSRKQLGRHTNAAILALESYRSWIEQQLPAWPSDTAVGAEAYRFFLNEVALMPYSPEQLLGMARQEWQRAVAFEAYERGRNAGLPELAVFPDQAAQITRQQLQEEAIRRFLEEKKILSVPAWVRHYRYRPLPAYLDALSAFGEATEFTSPTRLTEDATRYIPKPSPALGYFALSMAQDPRADMVHEGVPGHHFQLALAYAHENQLRRHYYDAGSNEGIGFYAEEMMLQAGLFDDSPKTREMLYSYMRLRALRVEVDVKLATGAFSLDDAADYLEKTMPLDRASARHEAAEFAAMPGQKISYQIGKLQILKFLADARRVQGDTFELRAFHDFVWKNGNLPIALQRWERLGLRDEIDAIDASRKHQEGVLVGSRTGARPDPLDQGGSVAKDDEAPKSALEIAMARLRKQDKDAGVEERPVTEKQRTAIAELRKLYEAKLAEREILHQSALRKARDPEAFTALEEEYRRDRERIASERDRKIEEARKAG